MPYSLSGDVPVLFTSRKRKFLTLTLSASSLIVSGALSSFSSDLLKRRPMLPPRSSFAKTNMPSLTLSLFMWSVPSFLNPLRENVVTMDLALATVSSRSPFQSVTGALSIRTTSLSTNAEKGFRWIFENSTRPFSASPRASTAFLAAKVWTAGVCNRIQQAKSTEAVTTMMPRNILIAFFNNRKPRRCASGGL